MEATADAILVVDPNQKRILVNSKIATLFHVPSAIMNNDDDSLLLNHVMSLVNSPDQFISKVKYLYEHVTETSTDRVELKDGGMLERYSAPVVGKNGVNFGRIWTFHEVMGTMST